MSNPHTDRIVHASFLDLPRFLRRRFALHFSADAAHLARTYGAALAERYLWHEIGDVHLLL